MEIRDILKAMIIDEKYKPGERINIDGLVKDFGVSKIPIREALKALEIEELVVYKERAGWNVADISLEKFKETLEIQYVLEKHIAEHLIDKINYRSADVARILGEMLEANSMFREYSRLREYNKAMEQNFVFHALYYSLYPNKSLGYYMKILWSRDLQFRREITMSETYWPTFFSEHEAIVKAIREKSGEKLLEKMESHFGRSIEMVGSVYERYLDRLKKESPDQID
jgi:DNA-binding GntR family transcriptional regulator